MMRTTSGHFYLREKQRCPLTVSEQIENLKLLNLQIDNEAFAAQFLNHVSYFRFIKAYSLGLKPRNRCHSGSVSFEHLVDLYEFNTKFRHLLFPQIEKIEITLRCRLSNYFCVTYGVLGYQDSRNFSSSVFHHSFLQEAQNEINRNRRAPFIKNFQENHEDSAIPFYALVEIFSFGTLSKFFKNLKNPDKKAIASTYQAAFPYFESWSESISYVRNICAHYGRLYNNKLTKKPKLYKEDQIVGVSTERIFGGLCCMKHLLAEDTSWEEFLSNIDALFQKHPKTDIKRWDSLRIGKIY